MNELKIFENNEFGKVRTLNHEGEAYFVGKDVAEILGYKNTKDALTRHVDNEDKDGVEIPDPMGRLQNTTVINESGLYSLILNSGLPNAKKFKRWVTSEVLPTIRQYGVYAKEDLLDDPDALIEILKRYKLSKKENEQLQLENKIQSQQIQELRPKADYTDSILQNKGLVTISQIAKDYGMSGNGMNKVLHNLKVQYKQSGQWLLYAKYQDRGYTHSETVSITRTNGLKDVSMNTKWTQKGRLFLYELLKNNGILPVIERGA